MAEFNFSQIGRAAIDSANRNKIPVVYDFAYGDYKAQLDFFSKLSDIQDALAKGEEPELETGQKVDVNTVGGSLALSTYINGSLTPRRDAMGGLAKAGLKNEQKLFTLQ
jgi:hypothetical protein